jgi:multiple sugar transport system permease protein
MRFRVCLALLCLIWVTPVLAAQRTLHFWAVTGAIEDVDLFKKLASEFEGKTGVHVEVTSLAWGDFKTKYFAAMAAGLPPDIGVTNLGGPFDYGTVGGLVDLRAEFPKEAKELEAEFDPKMLKTTEVGNKLYGVPSDLSTLLVYYRTDVFKQLSLSPPTTWSQLNETINKLEGEGYQYYFGFTAGQQWALTLYTMAYGLPSSGPDASGKPFVPWMDPHYQEGVFEALNLWNMHISPGKDLGGRAIGMFASMDKDTCVPLMLDLPAVASQIHITQPQLDGKWAMAPWPKADDGTPFNIMGGTSYVIFRQSKLKKEAMQWMLFVNSPDSQRQMIVDHVSRGQNSNYYVSAVNTIWSPSNDGFWKTKELTPSSDVHDVLAQVIPTLQTTESVHGSVEAGRMEGNLLDSMATYIQDRLQALADKAGLSKSELIKSWGQGKMLDLREGLYADVKAKTVAEYAKITPQAQATIDDETAKYQERYGNILNHLDEAQKAGDALLVSKIFAGLLFSGCFIAVVSRPKLRKFWVSYAFVAVPLVLALVFVFVPALVALYLSFTQYHPVLPLSTAHWVGLSNYKEIAHSGDLASGLGRTVYYTLATLPIGIMLALFFAYMLNNKLRLQRMWRFFYFSPLVTSVVSIALIFTQLFLGAKQGWLNAFLLKVHAIKDPVPFLTSERTFLNCIVTLAIWHGLAFTVLVFLAGFQQVPTELFEAAAVDGASPIRKFWNIAVPGVRPQVFFVSVLGIVGSFQVFEIIYMLANKSGDAGARFGPNDAGLTVVPLLYHYGFETFEMGKSAAVAYVLFVIILLITAVQLKIYQKNEV